MYSEYPDVVTTTPDVRTKGPLKLAYDITILDQDHTNDEAVNSFDEFQRWGRATSLLFLPRIPAMIIGMMLRITM